MPFMWCFVGGHAIRVVSRGRSCHSCGVVVSVHVRLWVVVIVGGCAVGGAQWWGVGGVWWPAIGGWWWVLVALCGGLVVWWRRCCGCVEGPDGACNGCRFLSSSE